MTGETDYYADLGVSRNASAAEITKSFRKLALTCHPDRGGDPDSFSRISKAYETLSDAKARARYDGTGRTSPLTPEEEFRESFFNLGGENKERPTRRGESSKNDDTFFRASESKATGNTAAAADAHKQLELGARVRLEGLSTRPELNGMRGVLVARQEEGKWQVSLDGGGGDKVLKAKNLVLEKPPFSWTSAPQKPARPAPSPAGRKDVQPSLKKDVVHPTQEYRVVHKAVFVREEPTLTAKVLGVKKLNELVVAREETFDGWIHLAGEEGWMLKDMKGRDHVGEILTPVGKHPLLAVPRPASEPGLASFRVVFTPHVALRQAPSKEGLLLGVRKNGEEVLADLQTYGGWIHIQSDGSWMLVKDTSHGELLRLVRCGVQQPAKQPQRLQQPQHHAKATETLRPPRARESEDASAQRAKEAKQQLAQSEAQRAALATLDEAIASNCSDKMKKAVAAARAAGVEQRHVQEAEQALMALCSFQRRLADAKGKEKELRECIDEGAKKGYRREMQLAQQLLDELLEKQQEHLGLLERLASAARSGDPLEIKLARDTAKQGGVDMKEIARVFSLNVIGSQGAQPSSEAEPLAKEESHDKGVLEVAEGRSEEATAGEWASVSTQSHDSWMQMRPGTAVRFHGLKNCSELNGLTGVLVAEKGDKWKVVLDKGVMKLFKAANLTPYDRFACISTQSSTVASAAVSALAREPAEVPAESNAPEGADPESQVPDYPCLDGCWVGPTGEAMATIQGTAIQWEDGPTTQMTWLTEQSFSCNMAAFGVTEQFSAELRDDGSLLWSDGDVWVLRAR
eukprot:TRINITY_DN40403_c0_g1_i1.p1 TRINITY_DN40403_c0_g1~~TRINITY_DN40403_c0_g1_i1.p1  ORF type:complete len:801 (+),score=180.38 TRINITY_DN40403_c0_g1_i1:58-2460(+)